MKDSSYISASSLTNLDANGEGADPNSYTSREKRLSPSPTLSSNKFSLFSNSVTTALTVSKNGDSGVKTDTWDGFRGHKWL